MTVRLQQLTAPFPVQHHKLIKAQLLPLHQQLREQQLAATAPDAYLSLLQTVCTLGPAHILLAFVPLAAAAPPVSSPAPLSLASPEAEGAELLVGFALFRSIHDTFNRHRLHVDELVVDAAHRQRGTGTLILRYLRQHALDLNALYLTMQVDTALLRCQPFLSRCRLAIEALSFTCAAPAPAAQPAGLSSRVHTSLIDSSNVVSAHSQHLLMLLEPTYRVLRPGEQQLPPGTADYLDRLHSIIGGGAFAVVAHSADSGAVWGVGMCRFLLTVREGRRLHVDDLVVAESERSTGVGRTIMERIKLEAIKPEVAGQSDEAAAAAELQQAQQRPVAVVTLESGTHRVHAHRFYWRERFPRRRAFLEGAPPALAECGQHGTTAQPAQHGTHSTITINCSSSSGPHQVLSVV